MLVYPDAQMLDVAGPLEVFSRSARWLRDRCGLPFLAYEVELVADSAGPVRMSNGLEVYAKQRWRDLETPVDTLLVAGGIGCSELCRDLDLHAWLRHRAEDCGRIGSICSGALVLAAAGLLDGGVATTHWNFVDRLAAMTRQCRIDREAIFTCWGKVYTSAGVTTGIDLALALVEQDWGRSTATAVARELVLYRRRSADDPQLSRYLEAERREDRFGQLQLWILDHLHEPLDVDRLADAAAMSPRHFARCFRDETGMTPAHYVTRLRVEEACRRIERGAAQLKDVARRCGFGDEQAMRRAFKRHLGVLPQHYRSS